MDNVDPLRILFSFGVVLALIGLMALALRYIATRKPGWAMQQQGARLTIVETRMIDARRKLVLAKRDDVEYLLLIAPESETLLETIHPKKNDA